MHHKHVPALILFALGVFLVVTVQAATGWTLLLPLTMNGSAPATYNGIDTGLATATAQAAKEISEQQTAIADAAAAGAHQASQDATAQASQNATAQSILVEATATAAARSASGCVRIIPQLGAVPFWNASDPQYFADVQRSTGDRNYTGWSIEVPTWYNVTEYDSSWHTFPQDRIEITADNGRYVVAARYQFEMWICPHV